jgi:hypothetical protein
MDSEWHDAEDGFSGESDLSTIRARFGTSSDREMDSFGASEDSDGEDGDDRQPFIARDRRKPWYTSLPACMEACRLRIDKWKRMKKEFVRKFLFLHAHMWEERRGERGERRGHRLTHKLSSYVFSQQAAA